MKKLLVLATLVAVLMVGTCSVFAEKVECRRFSYYFNVSEDELEPPFFVVTVIDEKGFVYDLSLAEYDKFGVSFAIFKSRYLLEVVDGEVVDWRLLPQEERIEVFKDEFSDITEEVECSSPKYFVYVEKNKDGEEISFPIATVTDKYANEYDISLEDLTDREVLIMTLEARQFKLKIKNDKILDWEVVK